MGAVQKEARRRNPRALRQAAADSRTRPPSARGSRIGKSAATIRPRPNPAARMPSGVRIISTASAIHRAGADSAASVALVSQRAPGAVFLNSDGSARLQVRHHAGRDHHFRQSRDREVPDHHGRNRDVQRIRAHRGRARGVVIEQRLDSEFDGGQQRRDIDGDISATPAASRAATTMGARPPGPEDRIRDERSDNRHVEAVRADRRDPAIAEEHRLNHQRIEIAEDGGPGAQHDGRHPTPTACPVVPPGSGRLNIMMMNENAANTASNGTIAC